VKLLKKFTGRPTLEHFPMNFARRFPAALLDKTILEVSGCLWYAGPGSFTRFGDVLILASKK
jgi:hypothetical protein